MKHIFSLFTVLLVLSLALGCGSSQKKTEESSTTTTTTGDSGTSTTTTTTSEGSTTSTNLDKKLNDLETKYQRDLNDRDQKIKELELKIRDCCNRVAVSSTTTGGAGTAGGLRLEHSGPQTAMPNTSVEFKINVINPNPYPAYDVKLYSYLSDGTDFFKASDNGQFNSSTRAVEWQLARLEANGSHLFTYEITVGPPGTYEVCAYVTAQFRECVITRVVKPELTCELNAPPQTLRERFFDLCIVIRNTGDGAAPDVVVTIRLPEELVYEDGTKEKVWQGGTVPPNGTIQQCWKVKGVNVGRCKIEADVRGMGNITTQCAAVVELVMPDIAITKSAPPRAHLGREFTYRLEVKNTGNTQATDVMVVDRLPEGVEFKEASEAGQYKSGTASVEWQLGTLRPEETRSLTIRVKAMRENMDPGWKNTAKVTCAEGVVAQDEAVTIVEAVPAMHIDSYDTEDPVQVGETTVYVITIRNEGQKDATVVQMKMNIPEKSTFLSLEAATGIEAGNARIEGRFDAAGRIAIFDPIPVMKPGDSATFKVQIRADGVGDELSNAVLTFAEFNKPVTVQEPTKFYK